MHNVETVDVKRELVREGRAMLGTPNKLFDLRHGMLSDFQHCIRHPTTMEALHVSPFVLYLHREALFLCSSTKTCTELKFEFFF